MKTISLKISTYLLLVCMLILNNSCSDDGKDGAQGPAGTANVIYSEWIPFPADHTTASWDERNGFLYAIDAPKITQAVMDTGMVKVYIKSNETSIFSLPYTIPNSYGISEIVSLNTLKLFTFKLNNTGGVEIPTTVKLRYVIVPGGVAAKQKADYNNMTYEQLCSLLNIPM